MIWIVDKVRELIHLAREKNGTENDGSEEHPARAAQISLVNGRNCQSHEERTCQKDKGTERGQFNVEYLSYVQVVTIDRRGNLPVDQMCRDKGAKKHAVRSEERPHEDFLVRYTSTGDRFVVFECVRVAHDLIEKTSGE